MFKTNGILEGYFNTLFVDNKSNTVLIGGGGGGGFIHILGSYGLTLFCLLS